MRLAFTFVLSTVVALASTSNAQTVHQLPATPSTVAYGYYWSGAKPALRVKSGDIVEVETMLTNTPTGLERLGVKPVDIPQALRDIVAQDTGTLRGPGGHILNGPIYIDGADSGDVLEVRIQSITLAIDYASATATRHRATVKSIRPRLRRICADVCSSLCART